MATEASALEGRTEGRIVILERPGGALVIERAKPADELGVARLVRDEDAWMESRYRELAKIEARNGSIEDYDDWIQESLLQLRLAKPRRIGYRRTR